MWTLTFYVDNTDMVSVETGMSNYDNAMRYCERLYGNDIVLVDQEFDSGGGGNSRPSKGLFGWF